MSSYRDQAAAVETEIQALWERERIYRADLETPGSQKLFVLGMFPYPSGNAHLGHVFVYSICDAIARLGRFKGRSVLCPLGWDAFGLPAENAAFQNGRHPHSWTSSNIAKMRDEQLARAGFSFDLTKEIDTSSPEYYKWTQWLFLELLEHGFVYRANAWVNWDPVDRTVLANEQVINGKGWRSGAPIERRQMEQWYIRITALAEELWQGLDNLTGWSERAVAAQRNWIGRSEGVDLLFPIEGLEQQIRVFTTRPDTLFGVTALVLAPEFPDLSSITTPDCRDQVDAYRADALRKSEVERQATGGVSGAFTGRYAVHPISRERLPVMVADYVLGDYGSGAVMCVPAHDQRDFVFGRAHNLTVKIVVSRDGQSNADADRLEAAFEDDGRLLNSGEFSGLPSPEARRRISDVIESRHLGKRVVRYRLRDWAISRQRFWGCPIPVVWRSDGKYEPVRFDELPVRLPTEADFHADSRQSPLVTDEAFRSAGTAPDGSPLKRETDTMDTFMCSAWYAWRFLAPRDDTKAWDPAIAERWMPIDYYVGGLEHANQHMIYFRFMSYFLHRLGLTPAQEPVVRFLDNGMIRRDGDKMSKSKGNAVTPNEIVDKYSADALRLYILSDAPFDRDREWDEAGVEAKQRFLTQIWAMMLAAREQLQSGESSEQPVLADNWSIRHVAQLYSAALAVEKHIEDDRAFHVAIARIHVLASEAKTVLSEADTVERQRVCAFYLGNFLKIVGLFAPHLADSAWRTVFRKETSLFCEPWVPVDRSVIALAMANLEIPITVNGRKRTSLTVSAVWTDEEITNASLDPGLLAVQSFLKGAPPSAVRVIRHVDGCPRLVNIVV